MSISVARSTALLRATSDSNAVVSRRIKISPSVTLSPSSTNTFATRPVTSERSCTWVLKTRLPEAKIESAILPCSTSAICISGASLLLVTCFDTSKATNAVTARPIVMAFFIFLPWGVKSGILPLKAELNESDYSPNTVNNNTW